MILSPPETGDLRLLGLTEPFWTVPMALAWIIYRSPGAVRELMENYRAGCLVWQHTGNWPADSDVGKEWKEIFALLPPERKDIFDVTNDASRSEDQSSLTKSGPVAREEFWRAMKLGTLVAEGVATGETSHKPIRDAEWETFCWQPDPSIPEDALAGWWEKEPRYRRVFVRSADVIMLWPALDAVLSPVEQQEERESATAAPMSVARREASGIDAAVLQPAPSDAASTHPDESRSNETAPNIELAAVSSVDTARQEIRAVKDSGVRSVGKPRIKGDWILAEMRKMDRSDLCNMSEKDMEHHFKAVRSTCRHYRRQVLAESGDN